MTKLKGKRRKPYVVREGRSGKQKLIGTTATKEEGLILLARYNNDPWDIESCKVTLQELFEMWCEKKAVRLGTSNRRALFSAYRYCRKYANVRYSMLRSFHMQDTIDTCPLSYSTQSAIKNLWGHLDRFALELDIISKRYSVLLTSAPVPETTRVVFSDDEVSLLWENQEMEWIDSVLFFLYTGFRISEMLSLTVGSVDLSKEMITGGVKTEAGKNRIVPIHSKIRHIVERRAERSVSGFLFEEDGVKVSESRYRKIWSDIMKKFDMEHTPHECRHTFRSRLDSAGANKVCIDRLMGHKSKGTGERVYTHKNIEELRANIELIKN